MHGKDIKDVPQACLCSSKTSLEEMVDISRKFSKNGNFAVLIRDNEKLLPRLLPAYLNALLRYRESDMRAENLAMEVLLFISGTMKIGDAIKEVGAKDSDRFTLFANDKKVIGRFIRESESKVIKTYKLKFDVEIASEIAVTDIMDM